MQRIAHRGYSAVAPENTLAAFQAALPLHQDGVEFDVHLTADGVPVVMHDAALERTTNGTGTVLAHTLAELQTLDAGSWKDPAFNGERIPTLRDTLALLRGQAVPYIELKAAGTAAPTVALLQEFDLCDGAVVMSFSGELLGEVRRLDPRITVRLLLATDESDQPEECWLTAARHFGIHRLSILHTPLTPARLQRLHAEGYEVFAWTVDEETRMRELQAMGIDGIITNEIALLMALTETTP